MAKKAKPCLHEYARAPGTGEFRCVHCGENKVLPEPKLRRFVQLLDTVGQLKTAKKELDALHEELKALYADGHEAPVGWSVALQERSRVTVPWLQVAQSLWRRLMLDPATEEARVRAETPPSCTQTLVVNKRSTRGEPDSK